MRFAKPTRVLRRPAPYRPRLHALEDRLPPGELLSATVGWSLLGQSLWALGVHPELAAAPSEQGRSHSVTGSVLTAEGASADFAALLEGGSVLDAGRSTPAWNADPDSLADDRKLTATAGGSSDPVLVQAAAAWSARPPAVADTLTNPHQHAQPGSPSFPVAHPPRPALANAFRGEEAAGLSALGGALVAGMDDCEPGIWMTRPPVPSARQEISTAVLNGEIFVIAGFNSAGASTNTVEVYNPTTDTWRRVANLPIATNHNAAATAAGRLYAFAGTSNRTFRYNPAADRWDEMAASRFNHGNTPAVGVIDDKIYVAGGDGPGASQTELEVYDPVLNTWTTLAPMRVPRNHTGGGVIDGKLYVVGGRPGAAAATALEVYDPATNTWEFGPNMPTGRSGIGAAVVNDCLYVFGGELPMLFDDVEAYSPRTGRWTQLPPMQTPRHGLWASVIDSTVYLPGGATVQGLGATTVNEAYAIDPGGGLFIDNTSPDFLPSGAWELWPTDGYLGSAYYAPTAAAAEWDSYALWTVRGVAVGNYLVQATWPAWASVMSPAAPYQLWDGDTFLAEVPQNIQNDPLGPVFGGRPFQTLGLIRVVSGTLYVFLPNTAPGQYISADAVRVVFVGT
jgi:hypothetical protein